MVYIRGNKYVGNLINEMKLFLKDNDYWNKISCSDILIYIHMYVIVYLMCYIIYNLKQSIIIQYRDISEVK